MVTWLMYSKVRNLEQRERIYIMVRVSITSLGAIWVSNLLFILLLYEKIQGF
jgi:hypothetical protein